MGSKFENYAPLLIFITIVFALVSTAIFAYRFSSKEARQPTRRIALWAAAAVSTIVAFFASAGLGIPILEDFRNPCVEFRTALIGAAIVWAMCFGAWLVAIKCFISALRRDPSRPDYP